MSFHGLFLRTEDPHPLRELVKLRLHLPSDDREIELLAMAVHRIAPGSTRRAGIGVFLYGLDPMTKARWDAFVQQVRIGKHGSGPTQEIDLPVAIDKRPRTYQTELKVRLPNVEGLIKFRDESWAKRDTTLRTELFLEPNTRVVVLLVHPDTGREFRVLGTVTQAMRTSTPKRLALRLDTPTEQQLEDFEDFLSDDIHVTVDVVFEDELVDPLAQAS